ncbi:hypothetical protein DPMN_173941 [Dreissena polymorpha]|uniref:Uncharacterized protein n=1 Tax=Dreissena polymorpha TaxID=45954 RepID=A0A9D4E535_DREPO|nr:hypothetical protein DPMN_173941 [Dreissena polymorpha]
MGENRLTAFTVLYIHRGRCIGHCKSDQHVNVWAGVYYIKGLRRCKKLFPGKKTTVPVPVRARQGLSSVPGVRCCASR